MIGFSQTEALMLQLCGNAEMEEGSTFADIKFDRMIEEGQRKGISRQEAIEAMRQLEDMHCIRGVRTNSEDLYVLQLTHEGFNEYGRASIDGYDSLVEGIMSQIADQGNLHCSTIAENLILLSTLRTGS